MQRVALRCHLPTPAQPYPILPMPYLFPKCCVTELGSAPLPAPNCSCLSSWLFLASPPAASTPCLLCSCLLLQSALPRLLCSCLQLFLPSPHCRLCFAYSVQSSPAACSTSSALLPPAAVPSFSLLSAPPTCLSCLVCSTLAAPQCLLCSCLLPSACSCCCLPSAAAANYCSAADTHTHNKASAFGVSRGCQW